ncbi:MAG: carboxypeptidase-like regulatory domain-containing protein [Chitinophagales bacterium]|nr:carboxypeptidase-like regulatory domain-containing protein [Chitinophagales bacterium]MDW8273412.1 carboxypeptidase-like regulatory domain-containing protein [Chitinophagales bacterium]
MIKGKVTDLQNKTPLYKANVYVLNRRTGISSDQDGSFSLYVFPNDTIKCSLVGYIPKVIAINSIHRDSLYQIHIEMIKDFVKLKEVTIYPFRNKDEFKQAFMDAKEEHKIQLPGIAPPKYTTNVPRPRFTNPVSLLYESVKRKRAANPDFKP